MINSRCLGLLVALIMSLTPATSLNGAPSSLTEQIPDVCRQHSTSRYDPLTCWLRTLRIHIPDQSFHSGPFRISITNLSCTNFTLTSISSKHGDHSLALAVQDVTGVCHGFYQGSGGLGGHLQATMRSEDNQHAVDWTLNVIDAQHDGWTLPDALQTSSCQSFVQVAGLHFTGSASAKLLDLFRHAIQTYVSSQLQGQLRPLVGEADAALTAYLQRLVGYVTPYLNVTAPVPRIRGDDAWVDFANDAPWFTSVLSQTNQFVQRYLHHGFLEEACESCGFFMDGINGVLEAITGGGARLWVPRRLRNVHFEVPGYACLEINVHDLIVEGLASWERLAVLQPRLARQFVSQARTVDPVSVQANVHLTIKEIPGGIFQGIPLEEDFDVVVNASSLDLLAELSVGLGRARALDDNLNVDVLMDVLHSIMQKKPLNCTKFSCLVTPVDEMLASDVGVSVVLDQASVLPRKDASAPASLERDLDQVLNDSLALFLSQYRPVVTAAIAGLARGPGRTSINDFLRQLVTDSSTPDATCPEYHRQATELVNLTNVSVLSKANHLLQENLHAINDYVDCVMNIISDQINSFLDRMGSMVGVTVTSLGFEDMGSLDSLTFMEPKESSLLSSSVVFGEAADDHPRLFISFNISYPGIDTSAMVSASLALGTMHLQGMNRLEYDANRFRALPLAQVASRAQCLLVPINTLDLHRFNGDGETPRLEVLATVNSARVGNVTYRLDSDDSDALRTYSVIAVDWILGSIRDAFKVGTESLISRSDQICEGIDNGEGAMEEELLSVSYGPPLVIILALFIVAQSALLLIPKEECSLNRREAEEELLERLLPDDDVAPLSQNTTRPLCSSRHVSDRAQFLIPMLIVPTAALLVSSNLSTGATVDLQFTTTEFSTSLPPLFSFGLLNTAQEMLGAKIYALFLLVVVFSGIWPYAKLALMLFGWYGSTLSPGERGNMLMALDALGKFSLVDAYVLVLMIVAFRYHIDLDEETHLDVFVTPRFGFYGFLVATSLSLVAGHLLVYHHRRADIQRIPDPQLIEPLCEHAFVVGNRQRQLSQSFKIGVVACLLLTTTLLGVGMSQKCFTFDFGGIAGQLSSSRAEYSLWSLGLALPQSVTTSAQLPVRGLQAAYFFYAVVTPFVCLAFLAILLLCPMKLRVQVQVLSVCEIANAWSAIEVFCLSIVAALLQISTFAEFIVAGRCDFLPFECYDVHAHVEWNAVFLILGVLLYSLVVSTILRLAHVALHERIHGDEGQPVRWFRMECFFEPIEDYGPPLQMAPQQSLPSFATESEQDPQWREWKNATSVT